MKEKIKEMIKYIEDREGFLVRKSKIPRSCFVASDLSECKRYLVYSVLDWDKREEVSDERAMMMRGGSWIEQMVIRDLVECGVEVVEGQSVFELKKGGDVFLRGRIDGKILYEGMRIPFEVKSVGDYVWEGIRSMDDLKKKEWMKRYIWQMIMYLYGNNVECGVWIFVNRGRKKFVIAEIDWDEADKMLRICEEAWECVKRREYPEGLVGERCDFCGFRYLCLPDEKMEEAAFIMDDEFVEMIKRYEELKRYKEEYEVVYEAIKERVKGEGRYFVGDEYMIDVKKQVREVIDVGAMSEEDKKKYRKMKEVIMYRIKNLKKDEKK